MVHEYVSIPKELVLRIHDELPVAAEGFNAESNLDYLFETVKEFPESAGIIPPDLETKIVYVASYLLFHLVKGHPFNDGNKRTAFLTFSLFLMVNQHSPNYSEAKSNEALEKINELIKNGKKPVEAIEETFQQNRNSNEYHLIRLLFELGGADPKNTYKSPLEIYTSVRSLIIKLEDEKFPHPWLRGFIHNILKKVRK